MAKFPKTLTFTLTTEQSRRFEILSLTRPGKTPQEIVTGIINTGLYAVEYRKTQNRKNSEYKKIGRLAVEKINSGANLKAMREMGIELGLIVPDDDSIISNEDGDELEGEESQD